MHTAVERARVKERMFPNHLFCVPALYTEIVCFAHVRIQCRDVKWGCGALNLALLVFEKFLGTFSQVRA